jgi:hypothetical protein
MLERIRTNQLHHIWRECGGVTATVAAVEVDGESSRIYKETKKYRCGGALIALFGHHIAT